MNGLIAITGATGFAGRHAVAQLLGAGLRLRALVRTPQSAGLPPEVETVAGDLSDGAALARLLDGAGGVIHLAGAITAFDRAGYFKANAEGTAALVAAALAAGTRRFVHVSSLSAREPQISPYAASKRAGEEAVLARMAALNAVIIRPPAVYGPGDRGTLPLIRELTRPFAVIPGRPGARFSLIHGRDLARLLAAGLTGGAQGIHEISDGTPGGYGWADLAATAARLRGGAVRPVFLPRAVPEAVAAVAEVLARLRGRPGMVNRGKIAELYHTDWVSRAGSLALADPVSLGDGLAETVAWYREAGWLPRARPADTRHSSSRTS